MPRTKEVTADVENISVAVAGGNTARMLKSAFYAERSSTIEEIEREAKKAKVDKFDFYAVMLFQKMLTARFEYAQSKQERVLSGALGVLISTGVTEEEARKRLGLGE